MVEPVSRTVSIIEEDSEGSPEAASKRLAEYRDCTAYVLLGSPGAGKTTAFRQEADSHENGEYVSARDFINLNDSELKDPEWSDKLLFIDGLDEVRAGAQDERTPIDQIRGNLRKLGGSSFRLSCRTIDWWWTNDRQKLKQVGAEILLLALDPLTNESIPEILHRHGKPKNGNPEEFISQARQHGLDEWLKNPQTLLLLADSIDEQGGWPRNRRELYEKACETLLSEANEEHIISGARQIDMDILSKTAGRMCAVQLLSGVAGYTLPPGTPNKDYPALERVAPVEIGKQTARTRAFDKVPRLEQIVPEHQCTAEFLGGRYLAKQVEQGFSVNRILSLMSGADKVVVPKLQGIAAWFAAYSRSGRKKLIESNPLEIILYGDVESFDMEDKRLLLDKLREKTISNPWFIYALRWDSRLWGLASPDLHVHLKEALANLTNSESDGAFRYLILKALHDGPDATNDFSDVLFDIIKSENQPSNQSLALDVLLKNYQADPEVIQRLKELLSAVKNGVVWDVNGMMMNTLSMELYPEHISSDDVLDCLTNLKQPSFTTFETTWPRFLVKNSSPQELSGILDGLMARIEEVEGIEFSSMHYRLYTTYLAILREVFSNDADWNLDFGNLRQWFEMASHPDISHTVVSAYMETEKVIQNWLSRRPDIYKELFKTGVENWIEAPEFGLQALYARNWLFGVKPDPDFWSWCLDLAIQSQTPKAAEFYLRQIVEVLSKEDAETNLSLDDIQTQIAKHSELGKVLKNILVCPLSENHFEEIEMRQRRMAMDLHEREQVRPNWAAEVKTHEVELCRNRGPLKLLHKLALAYFDGFYDVADGQPLGRIRNLLDNDPHLIQVILEAFKKAISREDAPSVGEIIRHAKQGQSHPLTLPCLAGLKETGSPPPTDQQIRRALAFHYFAGYSLPGEVGPDLIWYQSLLVRRPDLVSKILIRRVRFQMRKREEFLTDSYELAFSSNHAKVASLTALPLLKSFPVRCTTRQLHALGHLLAAALLHCQHKDLKKLLRVKLTENKTKNMNIGQRVYWLAASLLISPKTYYPRLSSYLHGDERRIRHFMEFICQNDDSSRWTGLLKDFLVLESVIKLIGPFAGPVLLRKDLKSGSPVMAASELVRKLADHLAGDEKPTATETLDCLIADGSLSKWQYYFKNIAEKQRALRRQSEFTHCDINELLQTLDKKRPANVDDLVVLLLEDFDEMSKKIQDGSTNDWHQYWNQLPKRNPKEWSPKEEPDCRDAFLSDLQEKLEPLGIHAHRESSYANDTRADIQVDYKNLNLPIEVKKSHSEDLWKGIREQLIPKYTRDPGAGGRGIYLVFWFGEECSATNPETKTRPANPDELRHQLEDSLTPEEADKISIHVIDVAQPQGKTPFGLS